MMHNLRLGLDNRF